MDCLIVNISRSKQKYVYSGDIYRFLQDYTEIYHRIYFKVIQDTICDYTRHTK